MIHDNYWHDPTLLAGSRFEFTSGNIATQHQGGRVLEVVDAPNAAGRPGRLVIHTLDHHEGEHQTPWSYFKQHASLVTRSGDER